MGLNYKYPINENVGFEFGYDGDYVESDQSLNFEIDALSGVNDFKYNRGIHALYIEYENKLSDKLVSSQVLDMNMSQKKSLQLLI